MSTQLRGASGLRVTNVSYLNCAPYRAVKKCEWVDYTQVEPAECARQLQEDEADLACVPLAEFIQHGGFQALPYGITAKERVDSVLLVSEVPLEKIETIILDGASRTSVILLKVLLQKLIPARIEQINFFRSAATEAVSKVDGTTAALLIGDLALKNAARFSHVFDLAGLWWERTGLPFVFAVWAFNPKCVSQAALQNIEKEFEFGLAERDVFARECADEQGINRDIAVNYINNSIGYRLDQAALAGLKRFWEEAAFLKLLPAYRPLLLTTSENFPNKQSISNHRTTDAILSDVVAGNRLSITDAVQLAESASLHDLGLAAARVREQLNPQKKVSYIVDRNINYTNVCNVYCRFCAFYRAPGKNGGYVLSREELAVKVKETVDAGGIQILLQGGLNPELTVDYYEDLFRWLKQTFPINLHALSADEIMHIAEVSKLTLEETIGRLIHAGLGSLPGAGAELLVDRVRRRIARLKSNSADWLNVHRTAHRLGLISTCTMMFGVGESWEDRVLHMSKLRNLQDETGGFTAFITWSFQDENTSLKPSDTTSPEYLRVQALSRIFLDNIPHIQSSWVTQGPSVGQVALFYGADDFGSVMFEENVVSAAGTTFCMNSELIEAHIRSAGFSPWKRNVWYEEV